MLPAVEGLEPGDVLVIGPDGRLARSAEPYATNVVGVYSTSPGFVGGSDGEASSTYYAVNFTIGQSVIGSSSNTNYGCCLGYWCGAAVEYKIYLPLVMRSA